MPTLMVRRVVRVFACFFCFFSLYSYCMEEREQKDNEPPKRTLKQLRKNLTTSKKELQKIQNRFEVGTSHLPSPKRINKLRRKMDLYARTKKLSLCVPMFPYYFTSIEKAEKFINQLKSWGLSINYQFPENGRTVAHYALDLDELYLFEKPCHDKEIEEREAKEGTIKETNIQFHKLSPEKYLALQYQFIDMLLMQEDIDLTIRDNNGETPFECFISSILSSSDNHIEIESIYIPKIFDAIIRHGYNQRFKQALDCNYKFDDPNLAYIKKHLCLFPIYESLPVLKAFIREKLSDFENGINTTDALGMTILHRIFLSLKDKVTFYRQNVHHIALLFDYICNNYKPDFSIKNNYGETSIDCFFSSLLTFEPEDQDSPTTPRTSEKKIPEEFHFDISQSQPIPTRKKKSTEDTYAIFKQIAVLCPSKILRQSFLNFSTEEQRTITSFIFAFPIFINISDIEQRLSKSTSFLEAVDWQENSYLHYVVDFSKKYILRNDTLEDRLFLIRLLLEKTGGVLVSKKNKDNKIPLLIFIISIPIKKVTENISNKKIVKAILLNLAAKCCTNDRVCIINQCTKEQLNFLKNIFSGPYTPGERELVKELLKVIGFQLTRI